ncbi:MAG: hypothetical protein COA71_13340 [SAR86 cluster bacterium]|uniref:Uncharacterized protein n=1 Tax=SAR86 cluster bacterium TaxID=2030880 RepID=A0A2A5C7R5_9GAMM|nr:MAG: hypothetical protein COA71_13340 [SAR86 cluster bacterium]
MNRFYYIVFILSLQLLHFGQAQAAESEAELVTQMNVLIEMGRYQEAYSLAQTGLFDYEGEPAFDFAYGLAALESGRPNEAVFAFERIAFNNIGQQRVRLELARAYFLSENYAAAETLFTEVLASNPTENVRTNIQAFLQLINQAQSASDSVVIWNLGINAGTDSNINSATELGVIDTPIGDVTLSPGGQEIDDSFTDYSAGFNYIRPIDNNRNISFQANYNHRNNHVTDQFDLTVGSGQLSYNWGLNSNLRYSHVLRLQMVKLDATKFQSSATFLNSIQRIGNNGWSQSLTGAYTLVRYATGQNANANLRDINQILVSGVLTKSNNRNQLSMSVFYGDDSIQRKIAKNNETNIMGLAIADQFLLRPRHLVYGRVSFQNNDHQAPDPIFNRSRKNETFSTSVGWIWQLNSNLTLTTDFTFTDNESNIDLYSYDRNRLQTGLRIQF